MVRSLAHRGPDGSGVEIFMPPSWPLPIGLGHTRLAVIDLSEAARQPMRSEDGRIWLVFNGEIYNFRELRIDLERRGHRFRSGSDTEVILRLYEEEGVECVRKLNGMFALAILDRGRRKLVLARDPLGIKPCYYYRGKREFIFASEIKAILGSGAYTTEIDEQALYDYFTYLYVPCPSTIYRDVLQVLPAHVLELDLETMETKQWPYWSLADGADEAELDGPVAAGEIRRLLTDSVRRQLISDVPLGVFLSGGVDSTILTGLAAEQSSTRVKTFTVVFRGRGFEFYNEERNARLVAQRFSTEHVEIPVSVENPLEMLGVVGSFDQPFGNPTFYLMHLISQAARGEATVALCGAGGDELFAGYPRYRAAVLARRMNGIPTILMRGGRRLLNVLSDDYRNMSLRRARKFLEGCDGDLARRFVTWTYFFDDDRKRSLLRGGVSGDGAVGLESSDRIVRKCLEESRLKDPGNRLLEVDLRTFLPCNVLEYTDKMSMAVGLEVRVPYLDDRLVRTSLRIPFRRKLTGSRTKVILKEAFADFLPDPIRHGPKKGFNVPLGIWMRDYLDGYFDTHMSRAAAKRHGIINWDYLQTLRAEHGSGRRDNSYELFSILMFDVWYRTFIVGESADAELQDAARGGRQ